MLWTPEKEYCVNGHPITETSQYVKHTCKLCAKIRSKYWYRVKTGKISKSVYYPSLKEMLQQMGDKE